MNAGQLAFVALELEPMYAEAAKERQGQRTDLKPDFVADLPQSKPEQNKSRDQAQVNDFVHLRGDRGREGQGRTDGVGRSRSRVS